MLRALPVVVVLLSSNSYARPQYAAAKGMNDCTSCHYSPVGGGHKTVFGKITASHGFTPAKNSMKDLINGEFRALAEMNTEKPSAHAQGATIMSGNISGALDVMENAEGTTHLVAGYDFAGMNNQAKDVFIRWQAKKRENFAIHHVVVGRFNIPFGIVTDEHYTYVRQQTKSSANDYELGGMISGNLFSSVHYDLAFMQDMQSGGKSVPNQGTHWGVVPNLRMMFATAHIYIGLSGMYYQRPNTKAPWAVAGYTVWAPNEKFSLMFEVDYAKNMNDSANNSYLNYFVDSTASATYYAELTDKSSLGAMLRMEYAFNNRWAIYNKIDFLAPDDNYMKDNYLKSVVGVKHYLNSNSNIELSYEKKLVARDGIEDTGVRAGADLLILLGHFWF